MAERERKVWVEVAVDDEVERECSSMCPFLEGDEFGCGLFDDIIEEKQRCQECIENELPLDEKVDVGVKGGEG